MHCYLMFTNFQTEYKMTFKKPGYNGYFWRRGSVWSRLHWKNTARKSCFGRPEHIDGLPETELLEKHEMYEKTYAYQHQRQQAYHHQANQYQHQQQYSQHHQQRDFQPTDNRRNQYYDNKENKNDPQSLGYYLTERRDADHSWNTGEQRRSHSPCRKPHYDSRGREKYRRRSPSQRACSRSPRGYAYDVPRSYHSRSPRHCSSKSLRHSSRSSSRHRSSKSFSTRSRKRSWERDKRHRSRSSSKSESASESSGSGTKISPENKQRQDKNQTPKRRHSAEQRVQRPMSSVVRVMNNCYDKKKHNFSESNRASKNRRLLIHEKIKQEEAIGIGVDVTIGELSMSPISSEDFSQRSEEAESDGEKEETENNAPLNNNTDDINCLKKVEIDSSSNTTKNTLQNQEISKNTEEFERIRQKKQSPLSHEVTHLSLGVKETIKDKAVQCTDEDKSSDDHFKGEKRLAYKNDSTEGNINVKPSKRIEVTHGSNSIDRNIEEQNTGFIKNVDKCTNSHQTSAVSARKTPNNEENCNAMTAANHYVEEDFAEEKNNSESLKRENLEQNKGSIETLENTLLKTKIMPKEIINKLVSFMESKVKNKNELHCDFINDQPKDGEQFTYQNNEKQKGSVRDDDVENCKYELAVDEEKSKDLQQKEITKNLESHAAHHVSFKNKKYHEKYKKVQSKELNDMLTVKAHNEKLKNETRKEHPHTNVNENVNVNPKVQVNENSQKNNTVLSDRIPKERKQIAENDNVHDKNLSEKNKTPIIIYNNKTDISAHENSKQEIIKERNRAVDSSDQDKMDSSKKENNCYSSSHNMPLHKSKNFRTMENHISPENVKSRPVSQGMKQTPSQYKLQLGIQTKDHNFRCDHSSINIAEHPQFDLVNVREGQIINKNSTGFSINSNQKNISGKNKEKSNQTPTNLDKSTSHTLSLKDKKMCFEKCIKAKEENHSKGKADARKSEQSIKDMTSNAEPFMDKQEKDSTNVQESIDRRNVIQMSISVKEVPQTKEMRSSEALDGRQNTRERKNSGAFDLHHNAKETKRFGASDEPHTARERKRSGAFHGAVDEPHYARERKRSGAFDVSRKTTLSADSTSTRAQQCSESSPAIVKGKMNRPSSDVFIPLGRPSEKKRKLSPSSLAIGSTKLATPKSTSNKTESFMPVTEDWKSSVTEIRNKFEEANDNVRAGMHNPVVGPQKSLFCKNKKRISHYKKVDNSPPSKGQLKPTTGKVTQKTSAENSTRTNQFKKFLKKNATGSPKKNATGSPANAHKTELTDGENTTYEDDVNATVQNNQNNTIKLQEVRVRLSPIDNIFDKIKENTGMKADQVTMSNENVKTGMKRVHDEKNTQKNTNVKRQRHVEKNKATGSIMKEKSFFTLKDKNDPENVKDENHNQKSTVAKGSKYQYTDAKQKTSSDDQVKATEVIKQKKIQKTTNSVSEINKLFGQSSDTQTKVKQGELYVPNASVRLGGPLGSNTNEKAGKCHGSKNNGIIKESSVSKPNYKLGSNENHDTSFESKTKTSEIVGPQKSKRIGKLEADEKCDRNITLSFEKCKESCASKSDELFQTRQSNGSETKEKLQESQKSKEDEKLEHGDSQVESTLNKSEILVLNEKLGKKVSESFVKTCNDLSMQSNLMGAREENEDKSINDNQQEDKNCVTKANNTEKSEIVGDRDIDINIGIGVMNDTVIGMVTESESFLCNTECIESDTVDAESDGGDIEPIQMIGSLFINDTRMDDPDEVVMYSNVDVESDNSENVQIKFCDDRLVLHNVDSSVKHTDYKEDASCEKNETNSQHTNQTSIKPKKTPRKKFAPQLESLGRMIEDEKEMDDFESEMLVTPSPNAHNKVRKTGSGESESDDEDDDSELMSSGVECTPTKAKTLTTKSQWLEKAKNKKLKVPENLMKTKEQTQTSPDHDYDNIDIIPNISECCGTFNKIIFDKGFGVCHTKRLINDDFIKTFAQFYPKRLYSTPNGQRKNLGKCLRCQSCSMFFTPLAFTVHHDTHSIVKQIDTERSKQLSFILLEKGDVDTKKMFKDFITYFHAQRNKRNGASPVQLPRTTTPTVEDNGLCTDDTVALQVLQKDMQEGTSVTASTSVVEVSQSVQTQTKLIINSIPVVTNACPVSTNTMQLQRQVNQDSCGQVMQANQNPLKQLTAHVNRIPGDKRMHTHQNLVQHSPAHVNRTLGDQRSQIQMNAVQQIHRKQTNQNANQQFLQGVNQTSANQRRQVQQYAVQQFPSPVNQIGQTLQYAEQQLSSQIQYSEAQSGGLQVNEFQSQIHQTPDGPVWQQMQQQVNNSSQIQGKPQQLSVPNNFPRKQQCLNRNSSSFSVLPQQVSQRVALSSINVGTMPMFNPLTAQYMDQNIYQNTQPVKTSDYTGIPFVATKPTRVRDIVPNYIRTSQQPSSRASNPTTQNMNYALNIDQIYHPGKKEPMRPVNSAQPAHIATGQEISPQNGRLSRKMSNEAETSINAAAVEEKRRQLLQQLLELDDIHTGDSGLDLILLGRKYVHSGLTTVNQEVLRIYRERSTSVINQPQVQQSQRNGRSMTPEERIYYLGQLRRSQQQ